MEGQKQTNFTFEIDNFSEKESVIASPQFSSSGCKWFVKVYPKGNRVEDHLSLFLHVANPKSLRLGWKRRASFSFILLNQSGKEIHRTYESPCNLFFAQLQGRGFPKAVPLKKLQEKGFLEKNKLIIKVEVKVIEVVDAAQVTGKETMDVCGFQVLYSQAFRVTWIFEEHPDIAVNFKPKSQLVKTTYMNILLGLIDTLNKLPHSLSETELSNAQSVLIDLTEAGFKLDWLKTKLDDVYLERKKIADGSRVKELEEQVKNLKAELNKEKIKSAAAKVFSLEETMCNLCRAELNNENVKAATSASRDWLKGVAHSWKVMKNRLKNAS
ncbi:MATH domain and coiled-coil domain-containing protein At2g42470 [Eutrema salsugineum]|uniref:MATH domain and coiled-coil domain-containing protein At2g42470 n=1 Tax=Eutrema salsugineum TaxID=72664 RepID=UPI000CED3518|nr:MATH domain and coiled-coil domain-containing protein At2g42470 [Eutrema salsugineum]